MIGEEFLVKKQVSGLVDEAQLKIELGRRLRAARSAQGRTLAEVAIDAGLSLPYVANLESGRGNPTLGALHALSSALTTPLTALLADESDISEQRALPKAVKEFTQGTRFRAEAARLGAERKQESRAMRTALQTAMAAVCEQSPRPLDELDCHRLLDALVALYRPKA